MSEQASHDAMMTFYVFIGEEVVDCWLVHSSSLAGGMNHMLAMIVGYELVTHP
jgi:hypothetical protein